MFSRNTLKTSLIIIFIVPAIFAISVRSQNKPTKTDADQTNYGTAIEKWRNERIEEVNGENGWTTLVGLFWLKPGSNKLGSDPSNDILLPRTAPKALGSIHLDNGVVRLEANPKSAITSDGKPVTSLELQSDDKGKPTVLASGSLKLFVIKRGEKLGLRVKDSRNPARSNFAGLQYFPLDLKWKLKATFVPYNPPKNVPIINVLGMVDNMISPGALVFEIYGNRYRLDPVLEKGSKQLFIIFADKTSGKESYGAGRYLYADPPDAEGNVILDFNKAHNPPCSFTKFATCPLPPRQNRLNIRIEAGEKKYEGAEH
jgi:uncharacterized protein (DUF1684 family)